MPAGASATGIDALHRINEWHALSDDPGKPAKTVGVGSRADGAAVEPDKGNIEGSANG